MTYHAFELELEGQRILIHPSRQTAVFLDVEGHSLAELPLQTAAGSLQGMFSMLETLDIAKNA
jgi:hypothetical protein